MGNVHTLHLELAEKITVDFILAVIIEHSLLTLTAEAPQMEICLSWLFEGYE